MTEKKEFKNLKERSRLANSWQVDKIVDDYRECLHGIRLFEESDIRECVNLALSDLQKEKELAENHVDSLNRALSLISRTQADCLNRAMRTIKDKFGVWK